MSRCICSGDGKLDGGLKCAAELLSHSERRFSSVFSVDVHTHAFPSAARHGEFSHTFTSAAAASRGSAHDVNSCGSIP